MGILTNLVRFTLITLLCFLIYREAGFVTTLAIAFLFINQLFTEYQLYDVSERTNEGLRIMSESHKLMSAFIDRITCATKGKENNGVSN